MNHTPGPWEAKGWLGRYVQHRGSVVAVCQLEDQNTEANAKLIAAAPDLLEAMEFTLSWMNSWRVKEMKLPFYSEVETKLKAAIAKVKGGSA